MLDWGRTQFDWRALDHMGGIYRVQFVPPAFFVGFRQGLRTTRQVRDQAAIFQTLFICPAHAMLACERHAACGSGTDEHEVQAR